jgi:hypothetical protein
VLELCLERDELGGADGVGQAGDVAEYLVRVGAEVEVGAVGARHAAALPLLRLGLQGRHRRHLAPPGPQLQLARPRRALVPEVEVVESLHGVHFKI